MEKNIKKALLDCLLKCKEFSFSQFIIKSEDLARALAKSPNTIKEHIAKLKAAGRLKRIGSDRNGYWEVILTD